MSTYSDNLVEFGGIMKVITKYNEGQG